jgi:hypothetical protein
MSRYLLVVLAVIAAGSVALAKQPYIMGFEDPASPLNDKWTVSPLEGPDQNVRITNERAQAGQNALKIYGLLPGGFGATYYPWQDWQGYTRLSFDLWTPQSAAALGQSFDCWVYLKDRSYYWYQTPLFKDPGTLKRKIRLPRYGGWTHFDLDISAGSTIWQPGGHKRSWDNATHNPREFGIRFFGKEKWEGVVYLDNVTLSGDDPMLGVPTATSSTLRGLSVSASAQSVPVYEKLELTFPVDAQYTNPFDPEVVNVEGHFVGPSGAEMKVPGFWYQPYERSQTEEGFEQLIPVGRPCWKVRFAPKEAGQWKYYVTLTDARGTAQSAPMSLTATAPLQPRGYVRVSQKDPLYYEFENGDWYWPIGINMRDGGDDASKQKGTYDFDHYFKRFEDEGLNFVRTWMCAWWGGIEWSDEYHSRFDGVGRYNQYNAWRLDYCVDLARKHNLYLEITLNSHGQVRRDKFDEEWSYSPWNTRNGGYVASPAQFFTSADVKRDFRNRYRYIVARWGYSRNVMAFDLWNEVDLVEGYDPNEVAAWHKEMAAYLKAIDPWKHLVVTHICLFWSFGSELWQLPEIECVQSDAYWDNKKDGRLDMGMLQSFQGKVSRERNNEPLFNKPFVFIEYGPQTAAIPKLSTDDWRSRFRTGLWTSAVLPTAAQGMFWYQQEWDKYKLYRYQRAIQKLFAGYDRRGQYLRLREPYINGAAELRSVGMANNREGFFYVHNPERMGLEDRAKVTTPSTGATITVPDMTPGAWDVEYVDTLTGDVSGKVSGTVEEGRWWLKVDLPPVVDDVLLHAKRTGG